MFDLWDNWWNARQSRQIAGQQQRAAATDHRVSSVDDRLERLMLVNVALWELLKESTGLTDEQLRRKMEEVDLRDGRLDGRITPTPAQCPQCGRNFSPRHQNCIYCGASSGRSPLGT